MSEYDEAAERLSDECDNCGEMFAHCTCSPVCEECGYPDEWCCCNCSDDLDEWLDDDGDDE